MTAGGVTERRVLSQRDALRAAAAGTPVVKEVRVRPMWMEPASGFFLPPPTTAPERGAPPRRRKPKHAAKRTK